MRVRIRTAPAINNIQNATSKGTRMFSNGMFVANNVFGIILSLFSNCYFFHKISRLSLLDPLLFSSLFSLVAALPQILQLKLKLFSRFRLIQNLNCGMSDDDDDEWCVPLPQSWMDILVEEPSEYRAVKRSTKNIRRSRRVCDRVNAFAKTLRSGGKKKASTVTEKEV